MMQLGNESIGVLVATRSKRSLEDGQTMKERTINTDKWTQQHKVRRQVENIFE